MTKLAKINQFNRSGAVYYKVEQREDGASAVTLSVDFERVPEPDHSYVADYFEVHRADADVLMVFGKMNFPSEKELRNKIEIYFPFHPFMHQFWKSSTKLRKTIQKNFELKGKTAKRQGSIASSGEKVQTLAANCALIVNNAGQCVADFFLIAAKDIWLKTKKGDPLNVSAIVRVFMSEHILLGLLNRCDEIAGELKKELDIPAVEEDDENLESVEL
ncbi:MAG TPA: hypothetical protein VMT38_06215 [Terracidiphilus sp.]|nr:hypothetical protein [Terracidiphilus sp.]